MNSEEEALLHGGEAVDFDLTEEAELLADEIPEGDVSTGEPEPIQGEPNLQVAPGIQIRFYDVPSPQYEAAPILWPVVDLDISGTETNPIEVSDYEDEVNNQANFGPQNSRIDPEIMQILNDAQDPIHLELSHDRNRTHDTSGGRKMVTARAQAKKASRDELPDTNPQPQINRAADREPKRPKGAETERSPNPGNPRRIRKSPQPHRGGPARGRIWNQSPDPAASHKIRTNAPAN